MSFPVAWFLNTNNSLIKVPVAQSFVKLDNLLLLEANLL